MSTVFEQTTEKAAGSKFGYEATIVDNAILQAASKNLPLGLLLRSTPLYLVRSNNVPTAGTDGYGVYVNVDFIRKIPSSELPYILLHEAYHMLLGHPIHFKSLDVKELFGGTFHPVVINVLEHLAPLVFNVVTDAFINDQLENLGFRNAEGISFKDQERHPGTFINKAISFYGISLDPKAVEDIIRNSTSVEATISILTQIGKKLSSMLFKARPPAQPPQPPPKPSRQPPEPWPAIVEPGPVEEGMEPKGGQPPGIVKEEPGPVKGRRAKEKPSGPSVPGEMEVSEEDLEKIKEGLEKMKEWIDKVKKDGEIKDGKIKAPADIHEPGSVRKELEKSGEYRRVAGEDMVKNPPKNLERLKEEIKKIAEKFENMASSMKTAGFDPGFFQRAFDELRGVDVSKVVNKIKALVERSVFSMMEAPSWTVVSKKMPGVKPGIVKYEIPRVFFLVDTSGSISDKELLEFMGTVAELLSKQVGVTVNVIPWDATAYGVVTVKTKADMRKVAQNLRGGGGTVIRPALELLRKNMRLGDIVMVASDWEIADINNPETMRLFTNIANKASAVVLLTTYSKPPSYLITRKATVMRVPSAM